MRNQPPPPKIRFCRECEGLIDDAAAIAGPPVAAAPNVTREGLCLRCGFLRTLREPETREAVHRMLRRIAAKAH